MKARRFFVDMLASGFGSGHCPFASGTAGTAVAAVILAGISWVYPNYWSFWPSIFFACALTALGILASNEALSLKLYGADVKDPGQIVIDEFAGYFFAVLGGSGTAFDFIGAFFVFRFFDILKPVPVRTLEQLPDGYGVVLDDVAAGIYAAIVMGVLRWLIL